LPFAKRLNGLFQAVAEVHFFAFIYAYLRLAIVALLTAVVWQIWVQCQLVTSRAGEEAAVAVGKSAGVFAWRQAITWFGFTPVAAAVPGIGNTFMALALEYFM
jgi:hypothetical protein